MDNMSCYRIDEIKQNIDTVIITSMIGADKNNQNLLLELQGKLYEQFGIDG